MSSKRSKKAAILSDSEDEEVPKKKAKILASDEEGKSGSGSESEDGSSSEHRKKTKKRTPRVASDSDDVSVKHYMHIVENSSSYKKETYSLLFIMYFFNLCLTLKKFYEFNILHAC